jgi:hypothetical protein
MTLIKEEAPIQADTCIDPIVKEEAPIQTYRE